MCFRVHLAAMCKDYFKLPRLYLDQPLLDNGIITFSQKSAHYFRTVLRRQDGDCFRVFNGQDGEFLAEIKALGKKSGQAILQEKLKDQPEKSPQTHLFFAPLKKNRMDILIEKSVELGVTDLRPIITARTEVRKINEKRIKAQIIESAEQCERLDIPTLHTIETLDKSLKNLQFDGNIYACVERGDNPPLHKAISPGNAGFIIGPVGGFEDQEIDLLEKNKLIKTVSLGKTVYRAETASIICLVYALRGD